MNLEIMCHIVFLDETWVFSSGSEFKIWSDSPSQFAKKRRPAPSTRSIIIYAGIQNGFVSGASLIFVQVSSQENFEHWVL